MISQLFFFLMGGEGGSNDSSVVKWMIQGRKPFSLQPDAIRLLLHLNLDERETCNDWLSNSTIPPSSIEE